jgi:sugar phosphate permease
MSLAVDTSSAVARPTRVRYLVVALTILLGMVTYLDRVCISTLEPQIRRDLSLSKMQMSYVFSAFALSYALFGIPAAAWADRVGTRTVLTRIVLWWSAFTMATAAGMNQASMMVIRFLFGAGEAGAWPAVARTFSRWIPYRERGTIQGLFFVGAHVAGGLTPLLVMWMAGFLSWRAIFVVFGLIGLVWASAWHRWFRDEPSQHGRVNRAELQDITSGRPTGTKPHETAPIALWRILGRRNVLGLCGAQLPNSFAFYFCITWLPAYLREKHGIEGTSLGIFAGLPLVLSVVADLAGGLTTDWAVRRLGPRAGRAGVGIASNLMAGLGMILATFVVHPWVAAGGVALATAASMFVLGASWGTCQDVGGPHTAVVSATMNTAGQIGSLFCPIVVAWLVETYGDWNAAIRLIGVLFLLGALCWCFIDPRRPVYPVPKEVDLSDGTDRDEAA